jgi:hypothetical protein
LISVFFIKPVISQSSSGSFDEKSVPTWSNDISKFEGLNPDTINSAWGNADKDTKLKFLNP